METSPQDKIHYPIAIIGGGLAGSAAGAVLAKAGWRVVILERDSFPRDKICGEFLSGESKRLLKKIGCLDQLQRHDPPEMHSAKIFSQSGNELIVKLPEPALGISRRLLDYTLFNHACTCGADGFTDAEVRSIVGNSSAKDLHVVTGAQSHTDRTYSADLVIGAYGRRGKLDGDMGRPFLRKISGTVGLKLHHRFASTSAGKAAKQELAGFTEIYGLDGGYCGVNMVEGGLVNVCMLLEPRAFKKVKSNKWNDIYPFITQQNKGLKRRMAGLHPVDEQVITVAGMPFSQKEQSLDELMFIGDAAGMIAPLCGDGQAMALESGVALAELLTASFPLNEINDRSSVQTGLGTVWQKQWCKRYRTRMQIGYALQSALLRPAVGNAIISSLRFAPGIADYLAAKTRSRSAASPSRSMLPE